MECPVCCETYTDAKRLRVSCAQCHYDACLQCYKSYFLQSVMDPHCMDCRKTWPRQFLSAFFPATWLNADYRRHRENVLIEREKQLLPDSQHLVANYREAVRLREDVSRKRDRVRDLKRELSDLETDIYRRSRRAEWLHAHGYRDILQGIPERNRRDFIAPCPTENCRGFLGGSDMTCGVCDAKACTRCGVVLTDGHECVKEEIESFKEIKSHSRPCPKCAVPTFKTSGCSQMWCVKCHATWDWNTGDLVTGVIHNPHYFQYLRERSTTGEIPRQPGDDPCARAEFPGVHSIYYRLNRQRVSGRDHILELIRRIAHAVDVDLRRLRTRYREQDNADLRLKYLVNDLSEDDFRTVLQRREKRRDKDLAVRDVLELVRDASRDVMWAYLDDTIDSQRLSEELVGLCSYANEQLAIVAKQFKMVVKPFKIPALLLPAATAT